MSEHLVLYFIRHAQRKYVDNKIDASLTEKGIKQAQKTAEFLKKKPPTAIYYSPSIKTFETAQIIADFLDIQAKKTKNLHESEESSLDKCLNLFQQDSHTIVAFITHGSFIANVISASFSASYLNERSANFLNEGKYAIPESSITILRDKKNSNWELVSMGSTSHLRGE